MEESAYLCFQRGKHHYAIPNQSIIRILKKTELLPLPFANDIYQGVLLVDDRLVAVVDIELDNEKEEGYVICLEFQGDIIGVYADELEGMEYIADQAWVEESLPYASLCCEITHRKIYLLQL